MRVIAWRRGSGGSMARLYHMSPSARKLTLTCSMSEPASVKDVLGICERAILREHV